MPNNEELKISAGALIDELAKLGEVPVKVEASIFRYYSSSQHYAETRAHLITGLDDGIQIDQTNLDDKYKPAIRINFEYDQVPRLISTLTRWYLDHLALYNSSSTPEELGELDDHPF